jgi:hypothetical protein
MHVLRIRSGIKQAEVLSFTMPCLPSTPPGLFAGMHVGF